MDATLSPLFLGQLKNLHKASLGAFKRDVTEGLQGTDYSYADVVGRAREAAETSFIDGAKEAVIEEGTAEWGYAEELALLQEEIRSVADQCRRDETKKMINAIEVSAVTCSCATFLFLPCPTAQLQEADLGACGTEPQQSGTGYVGQDPPCFQRRPREVRGDLPCESKECV
jgi:hypothetical protein